MRKVLAAVLLMLSLGVSVRAQQKSIQGAKEVTQYGFAELWVEASDDKATVLWTISPAPIQKSPKGPVIFFSGPPGTEYTVDVMVIDWKAQKADQLSTKVKFLGAPGPPPPPPPPPPDVIPVDPLVLTFQTAANTETTDRPLVPKLAELWREAATKVDGSVTWGDLDGGIAGLFSSKKMAGKAMNVQQAISVELKAILPSKGAGPQPIDALGKATAKAAFTKVAAALEKVK